MITRPLDLSSKLSAPPRDLDVMFWVNVAAVGLFFALLGSRFVLAPGMPVGVGAGGALELPQVGNVMHGTASVVVSYRRDNMILFDGGIYEFSNFGPVLEEYARRHPGTAMLVRVDKQVSMQGFLDLCDLAREAGFANVLVAAEPEVEQTATPFVVPRR
jgi:biopolymer transport protein ExbD